MSIEDIAARLKPRVESGSFDSSVKFDTGKDGVIVINGNTISTTDGPADCTIKLSLSGAGDDARYFQISVPVQPGNSGGALVDERGNVVGVVSAKLSARAALASSGALPENVNYAIKSSYLLSFLESVPEVAAKLKEPETKERKFEEVVKSAEQAAVLVLVY